MKDFDIKVVTILCGTTEAPIDIEKLDLHKLKVKELKKILNQWDETCRGCVEKADFIAHIKQVKHKHVEL